MSNFSSSYCSSPSFHKDKKRGTYLTEDKKIESNKIYNSEIDQDNFSFKNISFHSIKVTSSHSSHTESNSFPDKNKNNTMIKGELHPKKTIIKNDYKNRDKFENPKKKTLYNTRKFSNASKLRKYNTERNSRIDTNYKGEKKNSNSLRKKGSSKKRNNIRNKNIIENKNKEKEIFERNDKFKRQGFNENYIVPRINPKIQVKPKLTLTEILMPYEQNSNPTYQRKKIIDNNNFISASQNNKRNINNKNINNIHYSQNISNKYNMNNSSLNNNANKNFEKESSNFNDLAILMKNQLSFNNETRMIMLSLTNNMKDLMNAQKKTNENMAILVRTQNKTNENMATLVRTQNKTNEKLDTLFNAQKETNNLLKEMLGKNNKKNNY